MKHLLLTLAILAAAPVHAGGPVIVEDTSETVTPRRNLAPFLIGGAVLVALLLATGNSDTCFTEEPTPEPEQPGGGC